MRNTILIFLLSTLLHPVMAQKAFTYQNEKLNVIGEMYLSTPVQHDAPVSSSDHEWIKSFKQYFHPSSFESYKSFFVGNDWPDITKEQYDGWQQTLNQNKLYLQHVVLVRDKSGQEYLVFIYVMETDQHSLYQSKAMKKVNGSWKHRHLEEDNLTIMLEQIGSIDPVFLKQQDETEVLRLEDVQTAHIRSYVEKFDRSTLFSALQPVMESKGVSAAEIQYARNLFMTGNDKGMMEYLLQVSSFDDIDLMKSINQACGFRLYNYFQQNEGN